MQKGGFRLLVIEDDKGYAEMLCTYLSNAFEVDWAGTCAEGGARLAGGDVDLILLDLYLPDAGGEILFERVRGHGGDAAIVVLTGSASDSPEDFVRIGAEDFLMKQGLSLSDLLWKVREALRRRALVRS